MLINERRQIVGKTKKCYLCVNTAGKMSIGQAQQQFTLGGGRLDHLQSAPIEQLELLRRMEEKERVTEQLIW